MRNLEAVFVIMGIGVAKVFLGLNGIITYVIFGGLGGLVGYGLNQIILKHKNKKDVSQ